MDTHNEDNFIEWQEYQRLKSQIQNYNQSLPSADKFKYLETYNSILEMRKTAFPLLLREGDIHVFDTPPVNCYLLPPLNQVTERWLLVFFVTETKQSQVQIMAWHCSNDSGATIKALAGQAPVEISDCEERLDNRPMGIECAKAGGSHMINLVFQDGELVLVVNEKKGILNTAWQPTVKNNQKMLTWIERCSYGDMNTAVKISRNLSGEDWQDDNIADENGKSLLNTANSQLGRLNGGDGFKDKTDWFYLASSRYRVYRLDKSGKEKLKYSCRLTDAVLDVLAVNDSVSHKRLLLVTVHNGAIYLLQDKEETGQRDDTRKSSIEIIHWQHTSCPIFRLIGKGDERILSLDDRGRLSPLRLNNPSELNEANDTATIALKDLYQSEWKDLLSGPEALLQGDEYLFLGKWQLEYFLLHWHPLKGFDKTCSWSELCAWFKQLNDYYGGSRTPAPVIVEFHYHIITRLFHWMQKFCFQDKNNKITKSGYAEFEPALAVINEILTPKPSAPDSVWTLLLRKSDWVRCWAEALDLFDTKFKEVYRQWEEVLWQQRLRLAPALYSTRPFHTLSSYRFINQPSYIEVLDEAGQIIAVLESNHSLSVLQISQDGGTWKKLDSMDLNEDQWQGRPMFLKKLSTSSPKFVHILVGTQNGELVVLVWDSNTEKITEEHRKSSKNNFAVMCFEKLSVRKELLLLGGKSIGNRPCLFSLPSSLQSKTSSQLWTGNEIHGESCLRMLQVNEKESRLWAINREAGQLLCWDLTFGFESRSIMPEPKIWLQTVQPLHRLRYSPEQNLLVCGGQGGIVYGINAETGALLWLVNVAGNLRHLAYLHCEIDNGIWNTEGLWLLCSDDKSSLVVNRYGQVMGTLENTGVVSTLARLKQALLVGTLDGRLVLMDSKLPEKMTTQAETHEFSGASPLQCPKHSNADQLVNFLQYDTKETLVATMVLRHCLDFMHHSEADIPERLSNEFLSYWQKQSVERKIVFLYGLREIDCKELSVFINLFIVNKLVEQCWNDIAEFKDSSLLCKFISPLLDILNNLVIDNEDHTSKELAQNKLQEWQRCIWVCNEDSKCKADCKQFFVIQKGMALLAIRLNQALKCWRNTSGNEGGRLFAWCNLMYRECRANSPIALKTAAEYLFNNNLHLLAHDNTWQQWLKCITVSEIDKNEAKVPEPLCYLQQMRDRPYSEDELNSLQALFDDNSAWRQWLNNLQGCLTALQRAVSSTRHEAWRERAAWRGLREHIGTQGQETFTAVKEQAMLALYWPLLSGLWLTYVDDQLLKLEQKVITHRDRYLSVETDECWRDAKTVEVTLKINNRFLYPLTLLRLFWENTELQIAQLPKQLPAEEHSTDFIIELEAKKDNLLQGELSLDCIHSESGRKFLFRVGINRERNLLQLSNDERWKPTWSRLLMLLQIDSMEKNFHWLTGDSWLPKDRDLLKQDIAGKFNFDVDELPELSADIHYRPSDNGRKKIVNINDLTMPVFSPDIALGAEPHKLLEQFHAVLHQWAGTYRFFWALAIWDWARGTVKPAVLNAFAEKLPNRTLADTFLRAVFADSDCLERLRTVLKSLPAKAVGSWCGSEPFYALKEAEDALSEELYLPAACLLTCEIWVLLDKANVLEEDVADFLGCSSIQVRLAKQDRESFFSVNDLLDSQENQLNPDKVEALAKKLLNKIGGENSVGFMSPLVWLQQAKIILNWEDFDHLYLLPKTSSSDRSNLVNFPKGLWLALEDKPLAELNDRPCEKGQPINRCIGINKQQALALLHTEKPEQALVLLNRFAATQININYESVFRNEIGLGSSVEKHFWGRNSEMDKLLHCLNESDHKLGNGSALLVGGRRMGKTSMRQRLQFELKRDQPKRVCLEFNFEDDAKFRELSGTELEHWFFKEIADHSKDSEYPFRISWPKRLKDNHQSRNEHRERLRDYLSKVKNQTKHTVLFTFDETEHFIQVDAGDKRSPYSLFGFLRALIQEGLLCLIATSYPYGAEVVWALNIAKNDSNSPTHNTFSSFIELKAWQPEDAWKFLETRLAGFGVILPRYYRYEALEVSRGVPWIVHQFGKSICDELMKRYKGDASSSRVVTAVIWHKAKQETLKQLHQVMKQSVENTVERQDGLFQLPYLNQPDYALSGGKLWQALLAIAKNKPYPKLIEETDWPEAQGFTLEEVKKSLPNVKEPGLRVALARLSSSPAIVGVASSTEHYAFADNLLLVWLHHHSGEVL